jgi:hypothetical protein
MYVFCYILLRLVLASSSNPTFNIVRAIFRKIVR